MAFITPYGQRFNRKTKKFEDVTKTKPHFEFTYPDGFAIVRDTREQAGLFTKPPRGLLIVRDTLAYKTLPARYFDYSIRGFEEYVAVEHKEIDDLWTSLTVNADDFKQKMIALSQYERKWLVIHGLESDYLSFRPGRKVHPNQIRQALAKIEGAIGVPVHQSESIEAGERWMIDTFINVYKWKRGI